MSELSEKEKIDFFEECKAKRKEMLVEDAKKLPTSADFSPITEEYQQNLEDLKAVIANTLAFDAFAEKDDNETQLDK